MTYVEGRLASPRAKFRALSLLGLAATLSFGVGIARNLDLATPAASAPAPVTDGVPEAVAYNGPLTDDPAPAAPAAPRRRAVADAEPEAPLLQEAEAPAAAATAPEAALDAAAVAPDEPLQPPPSV